MSVECSYRLSESHATVVVVARTVHARLDCSVSGHWLRDSPTQIVIVFPSLPALGLFGRRKPKGGRHLVDVITGGLEVLEWLRIAKRRRDRRGDGPIG